MQMQKIFGLDLGVASIGWAVIHQDIENEDLNEIVDCGVRVVPLKSDEIKEFGKGGNVPTNVARRIARGARRNLQRYRLHRYLLVQALQKLGMAPSQKLMTGIHPKELFFLREKSLSEPLTLEELGRVLLHLNLRRGYRSNRGEQVESDGKKQSNYLEEIAGREAALQKKGLTIGQQFSIELRSNPHYRVRQQIFNRHTYMEEFDAIWDSQKRFHPHVLTPQNRKLLHDQILYRQRPLKSQKGLVGECALEWYYALEKNSQNLKLNANGQRIVVRPKCAPKSSPLTQECKMWENLHNLRIYDERGQIVVLKQVQKQQLFDVLQTEEKNLKASNIFKILKINPKTHSLDNLIKEKGLESNRTKSKLLSIFKSAGINRRDLLQFDPEIEEVEWINPDTGAISTRKQLKGDFDQQPLYQLWHLLYATQDEKDLVRLLQEKYDFTHEQASALAVIDFTKEGYASKSHRAMRRLLPHYREGLDCTLACKAAGYNHSNSLTNSENMARPLLDKLDIIPKNSLRNPVVEKILNQMIHVVNALTEKYGKPDEIRVELARELKQSAKERQKIDKRNRSREQENKKIRA